MTAPELPSHHRPQRNGSKAGFQNPWVERAMPPFGSALKWLLVHRTTMPQPRDPDPSVFRRVAPAFQTPRAPASEITVTWVGHATLLVQLGGLNILTDPMWSARASPFRFAGPRRWVAPGVPLRDLPPIDVVLQSHNHYDHLDNRTVRALARAYPQASWFVPLGLESFVRRRGAKLASELDWWQAADVGPLHVTCVPAQHFSGRTLIDRGETLWCGWALATREGRRVFFAGDTGFHPQFELIGQRCGPFDLALLPIGAYEPRWFMRYLHMNPEEAVQAFRGLGAQVMVPIHWGTFKLTDEAMDEPPVRARAAFAATGLPMERYRQLAHGETLHVP